MCLCRSLRLRGAGGLQHGVHPVPVRAHVPLHRGGARGLEEEQTCMSHERTVPQLSIMIVYNSTWSILIHWIKVKLPGNNLT